MLKNTKNLGTLPTNANKTNTAGKIYEQYSLNKTQQYSLKLKLKNRNKPTRKLTLTVIHIIYFKYGNLEIIINAIKT